VLLVKNNRTKDYYQFKSTAFEKVLKKGRSHLALLSVLVQVY